MITNKEKSIKINKNLFIPQWIAELLDLEGERCEGPGGIAAVAIYTFCKMADKDKNTAIKQYKAKEIDYIYPMGSQTSKGENPPTKCSELQKKKQKEREQLR